MKRNLSCLLGMHKFKTENAYPIPKKELVHCVRCFKIKLIKTNSMKMPKLSIIISFIFGIILGVPLFFIFLYLKDLIFNL